MRTCTQPGCDKPHRGHGLCNMHLHRLRTHGDPEATKYKRHWLHKGTYNIWHNMMDRCHNPESRSYADYGARGIAVCERWHEFTNFYADMGQHPPGLSLERRDNDLGYNPDNCEWATRKAQQRNRRCNRLTIEDARTIRARCAAGEKQKDVAADYDLAPAYVSSIVKERIWAEDTPIRAPIT